MVGDILRASGDISSTYPLTEVVSLFQENFSNIDIPDGEAASRQRSWDDIVSTTALSGLLENSNQVHRARLLASSSPHSGAWLNATPIASLGLHLDSPAVQTAVALRLGARICQAHPCRCGLTLVDELGHHALSCRRSFGRHPRHANINDVVKRGLAAACIPSRLEPTDTSTQDNSRPDGVTLFPYSQGKSLSWDSTCVDTFCASAVGATAASPGAAADRAERDKRLKYSNITDRYIFEPIAVETSGVLGSSTTIFLRGLGKRITAQTGDKRETRWLIERVSLAVVRGNAASIMASSRLD